MRHPRGRPPEISSKTGIPVDTVQGGSRSGRRKGEATRPAKADSTWRRKAADFGCIVVWRRRGWIFAFYSPWIVCTDLLCLSNSSSFTSNTYGKTRKGIFVSEFQESGGSCGRSTGLQELRPLATCDLDGFRERLAACQNRAGRRATWGAGRRGR